MAENKAQIILNQEKVLSEIKEIKRLLDNILSVVNLTYKDRELIVETNNNVTGLKQRLIDNQQHQDNVALDIKATVHEKTDEVKSVVENKTDEAKEDIVKGIVKGVTK